MTTKTQKIISAGLNALVIFGGFKALITILNLNQISLFLQTSFYIWLFFMLQTAFLYDLHFKKTGSLARSREKHQMLSGLNRKLKVFGSAIAERSSHLRDWKFIYSWLNYLLLPGFVYWSTISIFFINFGFLRLQWFFAGLSGAALMLNYWYIKEIFHRQKEKVDSDVFVVMSMVKIYASALLYGSSLALVRHYCLSPGYYVFGVFALTFLLIYQALHQHRMVILKNLIIALGIAVAMSVLGYWTVIFWGYNYFTAAVFMGIFYNFFWGVFHYRLDHALSRKAFFELLIFSMVVLVMVFSVTNFKARLLDGCQYSWFVF
ncbi:MAG: hypothetical protein HY918_05230 [Candidatus Doudnabacteria bacterium]|nr:hypothetical protein [Candidatus Doudnabacteria bacterium]